MQRLRLNGKEVIIDYVINGRTLVINDLMINRYRDGDTNEIGIVLEKLIDRIEPEKVLYNALTEEEVITYTELGFDILEKDSGDSEFPHKCVMEYVC